MSGVRILSCRSADFNMFQMTYKYNSVSSEDFGLFKFPWRKVQHSEPGQYAHDLRYMFVVTSSSPPWSLINFFKKMTTRGEVSLRDITHKITFFQSLTRFIYLKYLFQGFLSFSLIKVFLFFFWLFLLQKAEICWHIRKISISCFLWSDRWKLHGEIQRHAIVITYMFMTNERCEDTFL